MTTPMGSCLLVSTEFQSPPDEAVLVLRSHARRLAELGATLQPAGGHAYRLTLPGGASGTLAMSVPADARSRPAATHNLVLLLEETAATAPEQLAVLIEAAEEVGFTSTESAALHAQLPLTLGLAADYHAIRPLDGFALIITGHFVTDLIPMVDAAIDLGVPPDAITVLRKEYAYRLRRRIDASLADRGIAVFPVSETVQAVRDHARRAARKGLRCLAIDDGGYIVPALLTEAADVLGAYTGVVEQTMSGIFKLEPFAELPLPVFTVAQSRLKGTIESNWIADAAIFNIMNILPDEKVEGQPALVIGYGNIGAAIAAMLRDRGMRVAVHDRDLVRLIAAHEVGFTTGHRLPELLAEHTPLLVIGTTGRTGMTAPHFQALRRDCFLASVSSRDTEFDLPELAEAATTVVDLGNIGYRYELPDQVNVTVLADGYPVNFHQADSVTKSHSDLICAALMLGACVLAQPDHGFAPGHNVARTDAVLEASGLLTHYYELYGPRSTAPAIGRSLDPARYRPRPLGLPAPEILVKAAAS